VFLALGHLASLVFQAHVTFRNIREGVDDHVEAPLLGPEVMLTMQVYGPYGGEVAKKMTNLGTIGGSPYYPCHLSNSSGKLSDFASGRGVNITTLLIDLVLTKY